LAFPKFGLGSGIAQMQRAAPKTYRYLQSQVKKIFSEYDNKILSQIKA